MKTYLKAMGRRKRAIRERKLVEEQLPRLMGGENYRTYRNNRIAIDRASFAAKYLEMFIKHLVENKPEGEEIKEHTFADLIDLEIEGFERIEEYVSKGDIPHDTAIEALSLKAVQEVEALNEANEKLMPTPKIRARMAEYNKLTEEIDRLALDWGL